MGIPLCVICCFSLAAFNICSLCLIFVNLINMCLGVFHLGPILFGALWVSWTLLIISFPILGKFSTIISSSIFSWSFFVSSSSGTPMIRMLGCLTLSQRSLRLSSFLLFLPFYLLPHLSYLLPLLFYCWFPPECFLSLLLHYSLYIDYFISSRSLLNLSCIISILVSRLFICNSNLFSRFGIIFTIIIGIFYQVDSLSLPFLFGLVGIYLIHLPAGYFSAFSYCLYCCVWGGLSVFWQSVVPLYCGGSSLWVGLDRWLVKVF